MNTEKILSEINQLKMFAELIINKATMLEQGLSDVVSGKPPKRGLSDAEILKIKAKREKSRLR